MPAKMALRGLRWLDRYAHQHASAIETISARDFPPIVLERIEEGEEGTATETNLGMAILLMARIGQAHGLQDAVRVTQALVLDKSLATLRDAGVIGNYHVDEPPTGQAGLLGATLKQWLDAVVMRPPVSKPPADR